MPAKMQAFSSAEIVVRAVRVLQPRPRCWVEPGAVGDLAHGEPGDGAVDRPVDVGAQVVVDADGLQATLGLLVVGTHHGWRPRTSGDGGEQEEGRRAAHGGHGNAAEAGAHPEPTVPAPPAAPPPGRGARACRSARALGRAEAEHDPRVRTSRTVQPLLRTLGWILLTLGALGFCILAGERVAGASVRATDPLVPAGFVFWGAMCFWRASREARRTRAQG